MKIIMRPTWLIVIFLASFAVSSEGKLKLLNIVFRHGDRAPEGGIEVYPNDPYANDTFFPMGLAGLTNNGKLREFQLGEFLREQYGDFLGNTYVPTEVNARSTNTDRTKMSLQLVLAGLYPPKKIQQWSDILDWQPIPAHFLPKLDDVLMVPEECPKYLKARQEVEALPAIKAKLNAFSSLMEKLTVATGKEITNSNDLYFLYHALMAEKSMGLELPSWAKPIFPHGKLLEAINLEYEIFSYNTEMKRLNGGMLLRRIIDNMMDHTEGKLEKKIFLYSGHETNIASMLQVLGVYKPHAPEYSSAVIVELHEERHEHYVKVKYYKGIPKKHEQRAEEVYVPGCHTNSVDHCTLDLFRSSLSEVTATDKDIQCDKRSLRHTLQENSKIPYGIAQPILDQIAEEDKLCNVLH